VGFGHWAAWGYLVGFSLILTGGRMKEERVLGVYGGVFSGNEENGKPHHTKMDDRVFCLNRVNSL